MYVRWAWAQAGIDVGLTTVQQWSANGLLSYTDMPAQASPAPGAPPVVERGMGGEPADGYQPGDIIFFGHGEGADGHAALYLGNGLIVQCSASGGGSNIRPLDGYVAPTGWIRWHSPPPAPPAGAGVSPPAPPAAAQSSRPS